MPYVSACLRLGSSRARFDFLLEAYAKAPPYSAVRKRLLATPAGHHASRERCFVLVLDYSRAMERLNLSRALHEYKYLLPEHLRCSRTILAWRVPRKIAGLVGTFRFPRPNNLMTPPLADIGPAAT